MNRCLLVLALPALLAAAPSPLIVGSVRDQFGIPIAGAVVRGGGTSTQSDAQGTFALRVASVSQITISCTYCRSLAVAVTPDEPVVALVHRYDALSQEAPSDRDVTYLPYAHAESTASLRPFIVLENSSRLLPGAYVSDRGLNARGSLVLDGGIPLYDVASNESPFVAFPAYSAQRYDWRPPSEAYAYGDLAGGGTLLTDTHSADSWSAIADAGSTTVARAGQTMDEAAWSTAFSEQPGDLRERADGSVRLPSGDEALTFRAFTSQDRASIAPQFLNTSVNGAIAQYQSLRENSVHASIAFNGGGYDGSSPSLAYSAKWSDLQAQAGVTTNGRIQFFADAGVRASSGYYATSTAGLALTAGAIAQTRVDAGAQTSGDRYSARLGLGAYDFTYTGGKNGGAPTGLAGGLVEPDFTGSYDLDRHWTLQLQAGESFTLPTILEAFGNPLETPILPFDKNQFIAPALSYGDLRRFHASITYAAEKVGGLDNGTVHAAGASVAWQIAPALSLRGWVLRDDDRTTPYEALYRFGARPQPATVGAYWLSYETAGVRVDAIYRQDLLDYNTDPHLDAALSVPVAKTLRIFGATERYAGRRYVTFGLRLQTP